MPRSKAFGTAVAAAVLGVAAAGGTAYGVLGLADGPDDSSDVAAARTAGHDDPSPEPTPTPRADPEPAPAPAPVLEPGDRGRKVRVLQARLKQLDWYAPDVTGRYDRVTRRAVRGFQDKRGFTRTGVVDRRTWRRVVAMSERPTDDQLHNRLTPGPAILGPGDSGRDVRELQARLKQIAWFNAGVTDHYGEVTTAAVRGFQGKREIPVTGEVDQRTMDRLLAMTREPTEDELFNRQPEAVSPAAGAPLDPRCLTGRALCIDKSSNSLRWVVDGSVQMAVDVRFGSDEMPTREGQFAVTFKSRDHVSSLYDTPMPYAMFFSGGQAVHYSPDFAANGYSGASHGCVNVRDYGAIQSLFGQVDVGDKVVVYWS